MGKTSRFRMAAATLIVASLASFQALAKAPPKNPPQCPYGTTYDDGCLRAPSRGSFINKEFFESGKQSGQGDYYSAPSSPSGHPPPWNVAGVDYPVGYRTSLRLKDPAVDLLPTGCTYSATGSAKGGAIVVCSNQAAIKIAGWNFSLHNCTVLDIKNTVTGVILIKNNKFVNGSNCSTSNGYLVMVENHAAASLAFERNLVDGDALNYPQSLMGLVVANVSGTIKVQYNAFLHSPARPVSSNSAGSLMAAYNYWEGFGYHAQDGHGEVVIDDFGSLTQPSVTYSYNTVLQPSDACSNCGTASFYTTSGEVGSTILSVQVDHNTTIVNLSAADHGVTVAASVNENGTNNYGTVVLDSNYTDPTGSYFCFGSVGSPNYQTQPIFEGNVNMLNGKEIDQFNNIP